MAVGVRGVRFVQVVLAHVDRERIASRGPAHLEEARQRLHIAERPVDGNGVVRLAPAPRGHVVPVHRLQSVERIGQCQSARGSATRCAAPACIVALQDALDRAAEQALAVQAGETFLAHALTDRAACERIDPCAVDQRRGCVGLHVALEVAQRVLCGSGQRMV